jgi:hypothetical protein
MPSVLRAVRDGGVAPHLRRDVWPLLLGLISPGDCGAARRAKWGALRGEFARLAALVGDDVAAAECYERQARGTGRRRRREGPRVRWAGGSELYGGEGDVRQRGVRRASGRASSIGRLLAA